MSHEILLSLSLIVLLGFAAQWLSWKIKIPSILFLLSFGILVGPIWGYLNPDKIFGELLIPFVSLSVAIILFEGGLTLKINEFREIGKVVASLISVGVLITWIITTFSAHLLFELNMQVSILLGAVLTVTGPTVIGPMLRNIRPKQTISNTLKWEGILIDPIGALLAILVFEAILIGEVQQAATAILFSLLKTILLGSLIGGGFALLLVYLLKKFWIPDYLHEIATLAFVVIVFNLSNFFQEESGLLAATLMGIVLANQNYTPIKKIKDFKENLTVIMIPILFILLSARLTMSDLEIISISSLIFLGIIILIARPISVFTATLKSDFKLKDKIFISLLAPRGIVAAAVSSVFAIKLTNINIDQIEYLVPITFLVIIGTVLFYGLISPIAAKILKISQTNPQGIIIAGGQDWVVDIAKVINQNGFDVLLFDTNRSNVKNAKLNGIKAVNESIISEHIADEINLDGMGKFVALTSNDEVNSLGVLNFSEIFEVENLFQLIPKNETEENNFSPQHLRGRYLFGSGMNYSMINQKFLRGAVIKSTKLSEEFTFDKFMEKNRDSVIPLFLIDNNRKLIPFTVEDELLPVKGNIIIAIYNDN
ncbi:MAG: hypothetical protein CMF23_09760 [Ignavibacteriae bacterium]|nr:hypothetical protein [Ignavibacteriota bacterium]